MNQPLLVGTRKGLFILEAGTAGDWTIRHHAFPGVPVTITTHDPRDGTLYAGLNHGHFGVKLHRSDDGGANWTELPAPAFPAGFPPDAADKPAPSVSLLWSLEPGAEPDELWAGTIPGALFHSTDRGASWLLVESLWREDSRQLWFGGGYDAPGIHSILPDPRDRRHLVLGVSCGGVWLSPDAGAHWELGGAGLVASYMPEARQEDTAVQDPHRIVRCDAAPDRLWMQHHCGIFRSDDGGRNWVRLDGLPVPDFGFAVAVHPDDPDIAWFVPAESDESRIPSDGQFCVTRTRDGGRSFERLGDGLPAPPAFDLVYRHGLAVAPDGRTLAMGSTTGGLWTSADGGERWQLANARLPPIASVQFAA
ncbi:hypothetical protein GCM10011611_12870 [Aliidongia dinghuensis]|uniref:Exo-alpha-sialidase n=1 Tax=Aliidongia dinghuensis TaxID=1867774 RepID=A0A8J2YRI3_9PROT|nr:sialidase family protein [Aliidongia dinghuensis]GGF08821.1 hypothetical protein GCM10011611_12870 [Aliidongia dinghuensis]